MEFLLTASCLMRKMLAIRINEVDLKKIRRKVCNKAERCIDSELELEASNKY